ncbi:MAG: hybrid sensor histidine kinase/response regulator [Kiritimatiellae bacterium]|nr:hybrid sensor histidine kinase/response regulator [Kiritimatiellia bacterium]
MIIRKKRPAVRLPAAKSFAKPAVAGFAKTVAGFRPKEPVKRPPAQPAPNSSPGALGEDGQLLKDYLFSTLAVDVRRPLFELATVANRLAATSCERELASEVVSRIGMLARTVDSVLDLATLAPGCSSPATEPADVAGLVAETVSAYAGEAEAKKITLSYSAEPLPHLVINARRLRLILRALVDASIKFTAEGRIGVYAKYTGGLLKITVEDTGCGVPAVAHHRPDGGVLPPGMSVIERFILSLNGDIELRTAQGVGTSISILFPNITPVGAPREPAIPPAPYAAALKILSELPWKAKFLLVDANPAHLSATGGMLRDIGFENIVFASSAADAMLRITTGAVDVVLTDLNLPRRDGRELVAEIRSAAGFAHLPVYAVTADDTIVPAYGQLGFDGYILKPVTAEKLHAILG